MLMLILLFTFSKSKQFLSKPGYHLINLNRKEQLEVSLSNGNYDCIFSWSHTSDNDAFITVFKGDRSHEFNLIGETTAIVKGDKAQISISLRTTVYVWIIKKDICDINSIMYTTPHFVKDNFKMKHDVDNFCLFFSQSNNQTKISLSFLKIKSSSIINVYSENSPENAISSNLHTLSKQFNHHFFLQIKDPNEFIHLDFEITGEEPKDTLCDHLPIHMITIDGEIEKEIIEESSITCTQEEEKNTSIIPFVLILVFIITVIMSAGIIYQTGCYKKIIAWWRGEIIKDGPAKVEIDPKELLKIDDIEDEEIEEIKVDNETLDQNKELHDDEK